MGWVLGTETFSGYHKVERKAGSRSPENLEKIPKKLPTNQKFDYNVSNFWQSEEQLVRVVREIPHCSDRIVAVRLRNEGLSVFFGKKTQSG